MTLQAALDAALARALAGHFIWLCLFYDDQRRNPDPVGSGAIAGRKD